MKLLLVLVVLLLLFNFPGFCLCQSGRIFGGANALEGSVPHQIALFKNDRFTCGGSIIAKKTILSAAHCVYEDENSPEKFTVHYGSLKLYNGTAVKVTSITRHPQYSPITDDYDVALLHLAEPIIEGPNAAIIELASETPPTNSSVIITGFGWQNLSADAAPAEHLQVADTMVVMDHSQCEAKWSGDNFIITDRVLCIISDNQTALPGDSGGPMVHNGKLVGVTAFIKISYLDLTIMDGYMNVAILKSWIECNINGSAGACSSAAVTCSLSSSLAYVCLLVLTLCLVKHR